KPGHLKCSPLLSPRRVRHVALSIRISGIFPSGVLNRFAPPSRREGRRWDSHGNHQLRAPLGAARRKALPGTPKGLLDIVLEVGVEEWERAGEPREIPLRDP